MRSAAHNFGWLVGEKAVRFAFGVGVGIWLARHLGPVRLGTLGYCTALVTLFGFAPSLGLDAVVKRDLLQMPDRTSELLVSSFVLRICAGMASYGILLILAFGGWGLTEEEARLLIIFSLMLFQPGLLVPDLWLQVQLRAKLSVIVQLLVLAIGSALRVWLILDDASLAAFAWVAVVEMMLCGVGIFTVSRWSGLSVSRSAARFVTMKRLLAEAWPLMFASFAIGVYMKIDEVMLRQLAGPAVVGIYSAAVKLSEIWYFLPVALGASVLPALLRARASDEAVYAHRQQQYYDISAAAAYILSVPIALVAPKLINLTYGLDYAAAGPILAVHIWSSVFVFIGVARGQWLVNEGLQKFYLAATLAGAGANVMLNLVLIPRLGGLGAAWATVLSYAFAAWIASYLHPAVRATARMQTLALLIPFRGWSYLRRR